MHAHSVRLAPYSHKISNQAAIYTYFLHITHIKYNFPIALDVNAYALLCAQFERLNTFDSKKEMMVKHTQTEKYAPMECL